MRKLSSESGVPIHLLTAWEKRLPAAIDSEHAISWEAALRCPPGWLLDAEIATPALAGDAGLRCSEDDTVAAYIRNAARWIAANGAERARGAQEIDAERQRHADMFAMRYGVHGEEKSTLQQVGDHWGLTRERIRQIGDKMLGRARMTKLPPGPVPRLAEAVRSLTPATIDELDRKLRPMLGESLSVLGADRFARDLLGTPVLAPCRRHE
jgi:hypothetical protein